MNKSGDEAYPKMNKVRENIDKIASRQVQGRTGRVEADTLVWSIILTIINEQIRHGVYLPLRTQLKEVLR